MERVSAVLAIPAGEGSQPVGEVNSNAGDIGGGGVSVFDHDFLPPFLPVELVQPFDRDVLPPLAVRVAHRARSLGAHLPAVLDLGDTKAGQYTGVRKSACPIRQAWHDGRQALADDILEGLRHEPRDQDAERRRGVGADAWEHVEKLACQAAGDVRRQSCFACAIMGDLLMGMTAPSRGGRA